MWKIDLYEMFWSAIPAPFRNIFAVVAILFFVWMLFIDKHDLFTQWSLQNSIDKLETDKDFYTEEIKKAKENRLNLQKNTEQFARERYFMSKTNEDVFIIEKEQN